MKFALVFCGQPRNICKKMYESFYKTVLSKYDVDVYAHFWYDPSQENHMGDTFAPWVKKEWLSTSSNVQDLFCSLYKPKRVVWETPLPYDSSYETNYTNVRFPRAAYNITSFYTSIQRSFQLIEDPNSYDFIIHTRSDLEITQFPETFSEPKVYVSRWHPWQAIDNSIWAVHSSLAKDAFSMVESLSDLYAKGVLMNDEEMFYAHLESKGLLAHTVKGLLEYELHR